MQDGETLVFRDYVLVAGTNDLLTDIRPTPIVAATVTHFDLAASIIVLR